MEEYTPPSADLNAPPVRRHAYNITENMVTYLRKTRPWLMFFGVMTLLGTLMMVGGGLFMIVAGAGAGFMGEEITEFSGVMGLGMGLFYLLLGGIYAWLGWQMLSIGTAIGTMHRDQVEGMELVLRRNWHLWRNLGLVVIAFFVLYGLFIVAVMVFGVAMIGNI